MVKNFEFILKIIIKNNFTGFQLLCRNKRFLLSAGEGITDAAATESPSHPSSF